MCTRYYIEPLSALEQVSHQRLLHPTIIQNLSTRKMVSQAIQMIYLAIQEVFCQELKVSPIASSMVCPSIEPPCVILMICCSTIQMHQGAMYLGVDAWQAPNGFDVIGAESAEFAKNILSRIIPDAIVLDRMMSNQDGLSFLKEIRKHGNNTPVIMLTAMSGPENTIDGFLMLI